jgi:hypothetical protein
LFIFIKKIVNQAPVCGSASGGAYFFIFLFFLLKITVNQVPVDEEKLVI